MKALVLILMVSVNCAFAWGPTGHRVVGEIAEKYLTRKAKRKIKKILDGHSFSRVSNWPDKIKSDPTNYRHTYVWHYMNWPTNQRDYDPNSYGSLMKALEENLKIFRNPKEPKAKRSFAIKFLVHLVGDLHQPLHVGNGLDQGGNKCRVFFHRKETNLHQLWDEKMIEFTRLSYTEMANYIDVFDKKSLKEMQTGTFLSWAQESKDLRNSVYPQEIVPLTGAAKKNAAEKELKSYCNPDQNIQDDIIPRLSYDYSYKFMPIAEQRMRLAGVRLAKLINDSF